MVFSFQLDSQVNVSRIEVRSISEVLGTLGGLICFVHAVIRLVVGHVSSKAFAVSIVSGLFQADF